MCSQFRVISRFGSLPCYRRNFRLAKRPASGRDQPRVARLISFTFRRKIIARAQSREDMKKVEPLYEKAIQVDPSFALAFARLSYLESWLYHNKDNPSARLEKSRVAANEALRLQPNLPEAHVAIGYLYYWADRDYEHGLAELAI